MSQVSGRTLKQKISFFVSFIVVLTSVISLTISAVSSEYYMIRQSKEMVGDQLRILASNYSDTLKEYQNMAVALVIDDNIQEYCQKRQNEVFDEQKVRDSIEGIMNIQENINFAIVIRDYDNSYVQRGASDSRFETAYETVYEADYNVSIQGKEGSTVRISFGNNYFQNKKWTLTLYHPIYRIAGIGNKEGMLVLNFTDTLLQQLHDKNGTEIGNELFLVDCDGNILSSINRDEYKNTVPYIDQMSGTNGSFTQNGILVCYQKIEKWNFYLVNEISTHKLYREGQIVTITLILFVSLITGFALIFLKRMISALYEPMNRVLFGMDSIKKGNLNIRIDKNGMDVDSFKLADGFNSMMDKIELLMEQAKEEQHQMEQIRFNALQAQIKPHFLYNTLECIHWQAVIDKNEKISTIVKALAQYYRICLSKGKEIITLEEELEHIRSYLVIQNMRYDNIIEVKEEIPDCFFKVLIPKLTLQPLVENAIYHGIRIKEGEKGVVHLNICQKEQDLYIYVANSGGGILQAEIDRMNASVSEWDESFGYGVQNVNRRISLMFGADYGLYYKGNEYGGVTVEIHLPLGTTTF